jgi:hypothetical protein
MVLVLPDASHEAAETSFGALASWRHGGLEVTIPVGSPTGQGARRVGLPGPAAQ